VQDKNIIERNGVRSSPAELTIIQLRPILRIDLKMETQ